MHITETAISESSRPFTENHMRSKSLSYSRMRTVGFLLFLLLLTSPALSAPLDGRRRMPQQRPARPFPPAQYVPSHDYDTRDIALDLHFDWDKEQAIGIETFSFSPLIEDLRRIVLDAAYMNFSSVKLANGTSLQYQFDEKKEKLSITLDRAYQPKDS